MESTCLSSTSVDLRAAQNPAALLRVAERNLRAFSGERIHKVRRAKPRRGLTLRTLKVSLMVESSEPPEEIAFSSGVQGKNLRGVEETELAQIAEERNVAGR